MFTHKNSLLINQVTIKNSANMKNIYSILSLVLLLFSISVFGQSKIYAPNLTAPDDLEVDQMPDVVLDWDAVTGGTLEITYELQIATNPEFTDAVTFPRTDVTAQAMSKLLFGCTYYWRVRAYDEEMASDWSVTWSFTVIWTVEMDKPNDGDEVYVNPEITWDEVTGISSYQMQVDTVYEWNFETSGVSTDIYGSYIVDNNDMWAVGADGLVLHNDGTGWTTIDVGVTENLNAITFVDANNGYIVGDAGTALYYDGSTWTMIFPGSNEDLLDVSFIDSENGAIVGNGGAILVYDSGTWDGGVTGDDNDLYGVTMLNPSNIWACGAGKVVVNWDGSEWLVNEVGTKDHYAIAMVDENNGWTVGKSGKIARWNGVFWYEESSGTNKNLFGLSFEGMNGYAVGASGTMLMFNGTWNEVTSGVSDDLHGTMITGDNGLIVGDDGVMMRKADNGFNSPYLKSYDIPSEDASWMLSDLYFGQTFYYHLRAIHDNDTSMWSGVKSFTTQASPELDSPSNSSETDLRVQFEWDEYEGTTNYVFEIDSDENFGQPRTYAPEEDTLWVSNLVFGEEYFWRVAAQHALDISDWSEVWSITAVNTIVLENPENEAVDIATCPVYTWMEVLGASEYEFWIDVDETFSNPEMFTVDVPTIQCQSPLEKNTEYYWKVRGIAGADLSEWSDTWSFKTEEAIGIDEQFNSDAVNIFPNPGNGEFNLYINSYDVDNYQIKVIDISGKLIFETEVKCQTGSNYIPITIDKVDKGTYNLVINSNDQVVTKRLVIQ